MYTLSAPPSPRKIMCDEKSEWPHYSEYVQCLGVDNLLDELSTWLDRHHLAHAEVTARAAAPQTNEGFELTRRALGLDASGPVRRSVTLPEFAFCNAAHGSGARYTGQRLGRDLKKGLRSCRCGIVLDESETSGGTKLSRGYIRRTEACRKRHGESQLATTASRVGDGGAKRQRKGLHARDVNGPPARRPSPRAPPLRRPT